MSLELFPKEHIVGVFRGFREGGMEFHADLALPYKHYFQSTPMHGQFLLVQLESVDEAVLGRITAFSSEGRLASGSGEEFSIRAVREGREIPENLRDDYLKYKTNIRVLGVLRRTGDELVFVPSHRRLPHVGSFVAYPSGEVLREIVGHNLDGGEIGHYALGEYIYGQRSAEERKRADAKVAELIPLPWMQVKSPEILVRFPVESLVSRRSFIFARAGFGKSNLNKLLFSRLYQQTPTVEKAGGRKVPVGTLIFDPDGEYFWPDDKGRPGLCDVPELRDKLVVFTARRSASAYYQSFVAGGIRLDIRRLKPSDVIAIGLSPDKQDQQNVNKLRGLPPARWERLVNLIAENGNQAPLDDVAEILGVDVAKQEAETLAARSNMTTVVNMIHDKSSQLMDMLLASLGEGKLCVVDVSQMRGAQALVLSGLILRKIFDHNQTEFTSAEPKTIPTIAVVEEAQSVLNERATSAEPYIAWVKEGRKYDLGALLITQQPGSIPQEILSQGDNWFIFHLLSAVDLKVLSSANAHFSMDLLSSLLNEPIPGQGVFWSSVGGKPYPVALRALSFEAIYRAHDPTYQKPAVETYAKTLRLRFQNVIRATAPTAGARAVTPVIAGAGNGHAPARDEANGRHADPTASSSLVRGVSASGADGDLPFALDANFSPAIRADVIPTPESLIAEGEIDVLATLEGHAAAALRADGAMNARLHGNGVPYGGLKAFFRERLPDTVHDADQMAFDLVAKTLDSVFGLKATGGWHTFRYETGKMWVKAGRPTNSD